LFNKFAMLMTNSKDLREVIGVDVVKSWRVKHHVPLESVLVN